MQEAISSWRDESGYLYDDDNQDSFNLVVANGKEESVNAAKNSPGKRSEVAFLMDKLVSEQQKVQGLEEQLSFLRKELEEARFGSHGISRDMTFNSSQSIFSVHNNTKNSISQDAYINDRSSRNSSAVPVVPPIWTSGESEVLRTVSLPQLLSKRNELLSSLHILSDVITRKRLSSLNIGGVMNSVSRENEAAIQASMHRLLGEAFYVNSVNDIKELLSVASGASGREMEVFDSSLKVIASLTEDEDILDSYENVQEFILHPSSRFTPEWRGQYAWSMRRLLVVFAVHSRKSQLLETRRTQLERITRQELVHTALLRAMQGRDVIPPSIHCLSPEAMTVIKTAKGAETEAAFDKHTGNSSKAILQDLASPVLRLGRNATTSRLEKLPSRAHASQPRSARSAQCRWNPPRSNSTTALRRNESSQAIRPPRESLVSTNTQRRRTATTLGLSSIYTHPRPRNNISRTSRASVSTRENSHGTTFSHIMSSTARAHREATDSPMIGVPVQSSMSPRAYSAARASPIPRRRLYTDPYGS
ncbi:uncharacterized protein TM35_000171510 [Trypanosoma theileri]|uniref:Uncharacterized protein n=1 Tax=Trypanosoma theileri TaxID=67003 RepID=A0A1X0NVP1_9TRYP|nr:uncharacterized protein TM35_000171510 [Trypanosoma theileri]ORC88279.1 hypothetical protein TM35_000171510 [Trypanosoma theileri]